MGDHLAIRIDGRTGPPFRQAHHGLKMRDAFALGGGTYHFFDRTSQSPAASNICSANSFFSLAFSSSSCFSRLASETSMPPYLAFQLYSVASETPCLRARSAVFAPASCSFKTPMICSSVNRTRFIRPSFLKGRPLNPRGGKSQRQVSEVLRADPNFRPQRLLFAI